MNAKIWFTVAVVFVAAVSLVGNYAQAAQAYPGEIQYSCSERWANAHRLNDGDTPINWTGTLSFNGVQVGSGSGTLEPGGWANVGANLPVNFKGTISAEINFEGIESFTDSKEVNCVPPPSCDKVDFVATFNENQAVITNTDCATCWGVFAVYNTFGHGSLEEGPQGLIGYEYGQIKANESITLSVDEYNPQEGCYVQLDAMVVASEEDIPAVVPDPLTYENQGAQWQTLINAITIGDHVCEPQVFNLYLPMIKSETPTICNNEVMTATINGHVTIYPFTVEGQIYDFGLWPLGYVLEMNASRQVSWAVTNVWYKYLPDANAKNFTAVWPLNQEIWDTDPIQLRAGIHYLIRSWFFDSYGNKCSVSGWLQEDPP